MQQTLYIFKTLVGLLIVDDFEVGYGCGHLTRQVKEFNLCLQQEARLKEETASGSLVLDRAVSESVTTHFLAIVLFAFVKLVFFCTPW
eukprot:3145921-Amphidinium_carterae.1